jgi:glutathione peroxidase
VSWNFGKFLIGADGRLIARYDSGVEPDDAKLRADIEKALK